MMELIENIRIFRRVAEKHSFTGVAQEMGVKQSTISKAVASLEEHLGVQLFLRSTRGVTLTVEGQKLLYMGGPVLDQLDTVLATVKNEKLQLQGQLKISASLGFARLILTPLFEGFRALHPDLLLNFQLGDERVNLVEEGIDLAIRLGPLEDSSLKATHIGSWERAVYASPSYIEKYGMARSIDDLHKHRLLYYNRINGRPMWTFNDASNARKKFFFEPYLQSDGADLLREALIEGLGMGYAPTWMMIEPEKKGKLVRMLQQYCKGVHPVSMVTAGNSMSAKQRAFTNYLRVSFEKIPELSVKY